MRLEYVEPSGVDEPTAEHQVGEAQETDWSTSKSVGAVSGLGTTAHTAPFHRSTRVWKVEPGAE
jgi:hypothetical protein